MTNAYGNVLEPPGTSQVAEVKPGDILASYGHGLVKKGVTLKMGQGVIAAGTVIARETSTKKFVVYNNGGSGGAEVALGVLYESVDTAASDKLGNIIYSGVLKLSKLTGLDSAAITDLGGRSLSSRDYFIF